MEIVKDIKPFEDNLGSDIAISQNTTNVGSEIAEEIIEMLLYSARK